VPESNGEEFPKSKTNPVLRIVLLKVIVVPDCTQKGSFDFAPGMFGVAEAESSPLRFISTLHAELAEPQVRPLVLPGFSEEHASFFGFFLSFPDT
jgi:hypothetical protein